jgi:hypothetical protein
VFTLSSVLSNAAFLTGPAPRCLDARPARVLLSTILCAVCVLMLCDYLNPPSVAHCKPNRRPSLLSLYFVLDRSSALLIETVKNE